MKLVGTGLKLLIWLCFSSQ